MFGKIWNSNKKGEKHALIPKITATSTQFQSKAHIFAKRYDHMYESMKPYVSYRWVFLFSEIKNLNFLLQICCKFFCLFLIPLDLLYIKLLLNELLNLLYRFASLSFCCCCCEIFVVMLNISLRFVWPHPAFSSSLLNCRFFSWETRKKKTLNVLVLKYENSCCAKKHSASNLKMQKIQKKLRQKQQNFC